MKKKIYKIKNFTINNTIEEIITILQFDGEVYIFLILYSNIVIFIFFLLLLLSLLNPKLIEQIKEKKIKNYILI